MQIYKKLGENQRLGINFLRKIKNAIYAKKRSFWGL